MSDQPGPEAPSPAKSGVDDNFDHQEARRRLKQLRAEQDERRRKTEEVRRREEEAMREQMRLDEAQLQVRLQEREAEQQRQREERIQRFRRERSQREEERRQNLQRGQRGGPRPLPLYKRKEEDFKKKLDKEEEKRREELRKKRAQYEPIDFVKLNEEAAERERELRRANQDYTAARKEAAREAQTKLPPLPNYYAGKVHERIVQETHENRNKVEIARERAAKMHQKAKRYAKLIAEIDPAKEAASSKQARRQLDLAPFTPSAATDDLQARLSELDMQIQQKEAAQGEIRPSESNVTEMLQMRNDLSALYIGSIKHKVELLHAIRTQRSAATA